VDRTSTTMEYFASQLRHFETAPFAHDSASVALWFWASVLEASHVTFEVEEGLQ